MKRLLPLAVVAAALTVPQVAQATTYCVANPDCKAAGGVDVQSLDTALGAAAFLSSGPDRIEIGPGDFTAGAGGFSYNTTPGEPVDIVGSGRGVTRLLNSSTASVERTLTVFGPASTVSDLSIVAPTPSGSPAVTWGLITSATVRRVDVSGTQNYIAAQIEDGAKVEDSTFHGTAAYTAVSTSGTVSITDSSIEAEERSIAIGGHVSVSRTRIDARSGPSVSGNATLDIADSLILTHGGPGLWTSSGVNTTLNSTGNTVVGNDTGSAGVLAGEGGVGHATHVSVSNTILTGYGHSVIANPAGGSVDVKLSHSDFDSTTIVANAGQVDASDANLSAPPAFAAAYHLDPSSPLVDAGDPATASQADLERGQRSIDGNGDGSAAPDIGAFEAPAPPPPPTPTPPTPTPGTPDGPAVPPVNAEDAAPKLSKLTIRKRRIARGRRNAFSFRVSEASRVRITLRRVRGVHASGALVRKAHAGRNRVAFRGKVGRRALKPGRYVATARATDSAGQHSARRKVTFTLLAPRPRAR